MKCRKLLTKSISFAIVSLFFISCNKNHEKIANKMLIKHNENECEVIVQDITEELAKEKYYKWNGTKCVLTVGDELESEIEKLIEFHKENHSFVDKKGNFSQGEFEDWMYFYLNPYETENPDSVRTDCFICWEKLGFGDYNTFEDNAYNSKEELIYNSFFGNSVREVEEKITEEYKEKLKIEWMGKCSVKLADYIFGSTKTINQLFADMPDIVTMERIVDGNNLIVKAYIEIEDEKVILLESLFQCVKASSNCYCMETNFTFNGQTTSGKVWGNVFNDPEGAGKCLSLLCNGIDILKVFKK